MKRILLLSTLFALLGLLPADAVRYRSITGSGVLRTETRDVKSYTGLNVSRGIAATLTDGTPGKLVVEADERILPYVETKIDARGVLHLGISSEVQSIRNCTIRIAVPLPDSFDKLSASSGATAACRSVVTTTALDAQASSGARIEIAFDGETCTLAASSGAGIKANLSAGRCHIKASSGADVSAKGRAAECRIDVSSGASCKARNLQTTRTEARASSGAAIRISCSETLDAGASSGGSISYWGDCRLVNYKKNRTGSVTRKR